MARAGVEERDPLVWGRLERAGRAGLGGLGDGLRVEAFQDSGTTKTRRQRNGQPNGRWQTRSLGECPKPPHVWPSTGTLARPHAGTQGEGQGAR